MLKCPYISSILDSEFAFSNESRFFGWSAKAPDMTKTAFAKYPEGVAVRLPGPSGKPLEISKWGGMGQIFGMDVDFC